MYAARWMGAIRFTCALMATASAQLPGTVTLEPSEIPEHALWRDAFHTLSAMKQDSEKKGSKEFVPISQLPDGQVFRLELRDADFKAVVEEASAQRQRDRDCYDRLVKIQTAWEAAKKPQDDLNRVIADERIACRSEVLDARDRLLAKLTPEAAVALQTWVESKRYTLTIQVPRDELKHFKLPH